LGRGTSSPPLTFAHGLFPDGLVLALSLLGSNTQTASGPRRPFPRFSGSAVWLTILTVNCGLWSVPPLNHGSTPLVLVVTHLLGPWRVHYCSDAWSHPVTIVTPYNEPGQPPEDQPWSHSSQDTRRQYRPLTGDLLGLNPSSQGRRETPSFRRSTGDDGPDFTEVLWDAGR
jgi:hypothetical protein